MRCLRSIGLVTTIIPGYTLVDCRHQNVKLKELIIRSRVIIKAVFCIRMKYAL